MSTNQAPNTDEGSSTGTPFRPWMVWLGRLLTLACLAFLGHTLWNHLGRLAPVQWTIGATVAALLGVLGTVLVEAIHAAGWAIVVGRVHKPFPWRKSFVICGRSQIAKYLPGNVFHIAARTVLLRADGARPLEAIGAVTLDNVLVLAAAVLVSLPGFAVFGLEPIQRTAIALSTSAWILGGCLLLAAGALMFMGLRRRDLISRLRPLLEPRAIIATVVVYATTFVVPAIVLRLLHDGMWPDTPATISWLQFMWGVAVAFTVGFVTPGSPGGLGVREAILLGLFGHQLGMGAAVTLFLAMRLISIVGDVSTFLVAMALDSWVVRRQSRV